MAYDSLARCVADLESTGQLRRIDAELDPRLEIAAVQRRAFAAQGPALLFTRPRGCAFPMLANLFGTRQRANYIFRDTLEPLKALFSIRARPADLFRKPRQTLAALRSLAGLVSGPAECLEARTDPPVLARSRGLRDLPGLVSWPEDGGPFITLPLVYSEDAAGKANLGMYRVQLGGNDYAPDEVGVHYQLHRGLGAHHAEALAGGRELPLHIYVGGPPALTLAAVMPLPQGLSEILFAGLLNGRRLRLDRRHGFDLPLLGQCDFLIRGRLLAAPRPEGPFGDHLGYYSLRHDFPCMRVTGVHCRHDAIWPFTTVGRPPQEDTIFGDIIHELVSPMLGSVFPGVREAHAVDAAGVHPLLLAIGQERYVPWEEPRRPRELLTLGLHLLGATQTSLAKYLLLAEDSPGLSTRDVGAFLAHMLERTDFAADLHFITAANCDTLDYSGSGLNRGSKLLWCAAGPPRRRLARELAEMPPLPPGFGNPRLAAPGILVIKGPAHALPRGRQDPALAELCNCLAAWPRRESFPLVLLADDPDFCAASLANFLWVAFTRSDPAADIYGADSSIEAKHWRCQAPLVIDARIKPFHAPPLEEDPATSRKVEEMARKGGPLEGLF